MTSTEHAELSPQASDPLISALACSLLDTEADVVLEPGSLLHRCYRTTRIRAEYRCNYGPNPARETSLFAGDFRVTARDSKGEVRGAELQGHPFFVGTLFQPERSALRGELPPVVREFVAAISKGDSCTES